MAIFTNRKSKFYTLDEILKNDCLYYMIYSGRSDGKTYAVLKYGLEQYVKTGGELAILRRWADDYKRGTAQKMFDNLVNNNEISKITKGKWSDVYYRNWDWYLCRYEENKKGENVRIVADEPFAHAFAISGMEHTKSTPYPKVTTIFFDEFITRGMYLPDEPTLFFNTLSTIIRHRDGIKVFMCGNTVNKFNPYFEEMGLKHAKNQRQGTIEIYKYAKNKDLTVAVEYAEKAKATEVSNKYFAFDNPEMAQIVDGDWELSPYPHKPMKFAPKDIQFIYFIVFDDDIYQCEIVEKDEQLFTYIHRKSTPLKDEDDDLIFSSKFSSRYNWRRKINRPFDEIGRKVWEFFLKEKVFYQDNVVGDAVWNYLKWCETD